MKAAVLLLALAGVVGAARHQVERLRALRPQVWAEAVNERDVAATLTATGQARGRETMLSSPDDGRVRTVPVARGDTVRKGQLLVGLDDQPLRLALQRARATAAVGAADVRRAEANVDRLRAELALARSAQLRTEQLFAAGLETSEATGLRRHDVRQAELTHKAAIEAVEAARASLRGAEAEYLDTESRLRDHAVLAPGDGVVTEVFVRQGQPVHAGSPHVAPSRLLTLAPATISDIGLVVDAGDAALLWPGVPASVDVPALALRDMDGRVAWVDGTDVRVRLNAPPPGLRAGMSATVRFTTALRRHVLAVPNHAVAAGRAGVWTLRDGVIAMVPIALGLRGDFYSEVRGGLSLGTFVVTGPTTVVETLGIGDRAVAVPAPIRAP